MWFKQILLQGMMQSQPNWEKKTGIGPMVYVCWPGISDAGPAVIHHTSMLQANWGYQYWLFAGVMMARRFRRWPSIGPYLLVSGERECAGYIYNVAE